MFNFSAAVASCSALFLVLAVSVPSAATRGERAASPVVAAPARTRETSPLRDVDALVQQLREGDRSERIAAAKSLGRLGKRAPKPAIDALIQALASDDGSLRAAASTALESIGNKTRRALAETLEGGACGGESVPTERIVYVCCRLGKASLTAVDAHVESRGLTRPVALAVRAGLPPRTAMRTLIGYAANEANRPHVLVALVQLRGRAEIEDKHIDRALRGLDEVTKSASQDALLGIDPESDRERMRSWLLSDDPTRVTSALWSVGLVGRPFLDLAPEVTRHVDSDDVDLSKTALWVIGSLALDGPTCEVPGVFRPPLSTGLLGIGGGRGGAKGEPPIVMYRALHGAVDGVVVIPRRRRPRRGFRQKPEDDEYVPELSPSLDFWLFASVWIERMAAEDEANSPLAASSPLWTGSRVAEIESAVPAVMAQLRHGDDGVQSAAAAALIEWGIATEPFLSWCAAALVSYVDDRLHDTIGSFLRFHGGDLAPYTREIADGLAAPRATGVAAELLAAIDSPLAAELLVAHLDERDQPWEARHYIAASRMTNLEEPISKRLDELMQRRFRARDYLAAPFLVRAGSAAHGVLREALKSGVLDQKMVAVGVLKAQGSAAQPMLGDIGSIKLSDPFLIGFAMGVIERISAAK